MKKFSIFRTRYVIVRDEKEILCGMMGAYKFRPFDKVKKAQLKTYESKARALAALRKIPEISQDQEHEYKVVPVVESIMAKGPELNKQEDAPCK